MNHRVYPTMGYAPHVCLFLHHLSSCQFSGSSAAGRWSSGLSGARPALGGRIGVPIVHIEVPEEGGDSEHTLVCAELQGPRERERDTDRADRDAPTHAATGLRGTRGGVAHFAKSRRAKD